MPAAGAVVDTRAPRTGIAAAVGTGLYSTSAEPRSGPAWRSFKRPAITAKSPPALVWNVQWW